MLKEIPRIKVKAAGELGVIRMLVLIAVSLLMKLAVLLVSTVLIISMRLLIVLVRTSEPL
jgi:hypothetical protein